MNAADWSDQVEWLQRQLTTLSKTVADHAHLLGQLTNAESGAIPVVNARLSSLTTFVDENLKVDGVVDKRFKEGGNKLERRLQTLSAEIRSLATREPQRAPEFPPGVEHHNITMTMRTTHSNAAIMDNIMATKVNHLPHFSRRILHSTS